MVEFLLSFIPRKRYKVYSSIGWAPIYLDNEEQLRNFLLHETDRTVVEVQVVYLSDRALAKQDRSILFDFNVF